MPSALSPVLGLSAPMIGSMVKNHPKSFGIQNTTGMGTMKQNKTPLTLALTLAAVALSGCGGGQ